MLSGFYASRSTAVFMDSDDKSIIHMEVGDSKEVDRHSSKACKVFPLKNNSLCYNLVIFDKKIF